MSSYVGPYRILRLINCGGQGSVYLGFDERLQRRVAVKIYALPDERAARRQLQREARLIAEIESPKIVQVHDVIESPRYLAMVMEYVPGCSLEDFLRVARPSLASIVTIAIDVAGALATARQHRVVHGDLKAANVLITESGHAKLTDFGIARRTSAVGMKTSPGSLSALAPEQYTGGEWTTQTDLFGLGILLYRMLSGEHPFMREGVVDTQLLLHGRERPLGDVVARHLDIPEVLLELVAQLLQKIPRERPRNTVKVRQVLREVTRSLPLASQRSLLREAAPFFRSDGPDDIATRIPVELGRDGRSRLPPVGGVFATLRYWFAGLRGRWRIAAGGAAAFVVLAPLLLVLNNRVTTVSFEMPVVSYSGPVITPRDFTSAWLVEQIKGGAADRLGKIRVVGTVGADPHPAVFAARAAEQKVVAAEQQIAIDLRCFAQFCLLQLQRSHGAKQRTAHAMLLPESDLQRWGQVVRDVARDLFS